MNRNVRHPAFLVLLFAATAVLSAEPGFQSATLLFSEGWTGNAYRQPYYDVTGSEAVPFDVSVGGGVRFNLVDPFLFTTGALTVDPRLTLGARRYLLYASGQVVPTQTETSLGADESGAPGLGSARVLAVTVAAPIGLEIGVGRRAAVTVGVSPTMVFRVRAGDADVLNDVSELNAMYPFFYGQLRWLRPEIHLSARFTVSDYLAFAIRATSSISMLDLANAALPWWDQFQVGGTFELSATPPFSGLFRSDTSSPGDESAPQTDGAAASAP